MLNVDTIVLCAGQESERTLYNETRAAGITAHLVGGADVAAELDAKRAIRQATELVATLEPRTGVPEPRALPLHLKVQEKLLNAVMK